MAACTDRSADADTVDDETAAPADSWLEGTVEERFETVAAQLRGFGATMVEVGHRYGELYFAGQDRNWAYAEYQIEEMEEAMEYGLQRRPARAASAAMLAPALARVKAAAAAHDQGAFDQAFAALTETCNACHVAEDVPFVHVAPPERRSNVVRRPPQSGR